jgi:hypothetical protein
MYYDIILLECFYTLLLLLVVLLYFVHAELLGACLRDTPVDTYIHKTN